MFYCGLDLASSASYMYLSDEKGKKVVAGELPTTKEEFSKRLKQYVKSGLRIAIEAGNQTAWVYDCLKAMGADVRVVNPNKVKLIAESRRKTDKVDAKILCDLLRLDGLPTPVHMPARDSRELRGLLAARRQLIHARVKLCNVVRGMLRQTGARIPAGALRSALGWKQVLSATYTHRHLKPILQAYFEGFKSLAKGIKQLDDELKARALKDPRVELLRTMPCVGMIAALTLIGAVDQIERFSSSRKLISYSGLAPSVRSSGDRTEYGSITREGRSEIRGVWIQIAQLLAQDKRPVPNKLHLWYQGTVKRRGKKTAIVALARKMLTIAFHVLKTGQGFEASKLHQAA